MKPLGKFQWIKLTFVLLLYKVRYLLYFLYILIVKCKTRSVTAVQHLAVTKLSTVTSVKFISKILRYITHLRSMISFVFHSNTLLSEILS